MRLKRVRIFGFKTFADKTEFDLDGDIVAIVGPNGCGKSNIVDAILWGLGEPNARNLRATSGVDVIFNGSAKRKPLGYAEVTLIFDNEDGSLPIDAAEVAVTRRFTRAGESHFSINRRNCRLKDIYDLLADSGLGRAGYAIVGQREIDQALSASAEERRAWIDEAAGVQRFRAKRLESTRRMEAAKGHLERLDQILADIDFQRAPLADQAEVARRYLGLKGSLTTLEVDILVKEICETQFESADLTARLNAAIRGEADESQRAEQLAAQISKIGEEIAELERQADANRELRQSNLSTSERANAEIEMGQKLLANLDELERNLLSEKDQSAEILRAVQVELNELRAHEARTRTALREILEDETGSDAVIKDLQQEIERLDTSLEDAKAKQQVAFRVSADIAQAKVRLAQLAQARSGIDAGLPDLQTAQSQAAADLEAYQERVKVAQAGIKELKAELADLSVGADARAATHRQLLAQKAGLEARARGIAATLDAFEGLNQGSQAVMQLSREGQLASEYTPVASVITTRPEWALALETALGGAGNDLIVSHDSAAKRAIEVLKSQRLGRATFQPLNLIRSSEPTDEIREFKSERGVVGVAADLAECEARFVPVLHALLGRVLIVETIDDAIRLAKTRGWSRMVSLDGEVVHSGGAVTGGRAARQGVGLIQRKAELHRAEEELEVIRGELALLEAETLEGNSKSDQLATDLKGVESVLHEAQSELREAEKWLGNLNQEISASNRERERLEKEENSLRAVVEQALPTHESTEEIAKARDNALSALARHSAEAEAFAAKVAEAKAQLLQSETSLTRAEHRLVQTAQSAESRESRLARVDTEREEWRTKIRGSEALRAQSLAQASTLQAQVDEIQQKRQTELEESFRLNEARQSAIKSAMELAAQAHRLELERARADSRRASSAQRLLEEYGLSEDDALAKGASSELPEDAAQIVQRLRRDMKALGDVNVGAIEAFDRLNERFTELDAQRQDVLASMEEIQHAVRELDRLTRDRFLNTFDQVKAQFAQTFVELFGGGEAALSLTDQEHLLSSGVDVEVTIPGKKRQRLELLSGGERSMSAVAFLFALLRVKPSPLVVLDEVDAPLDGRNVERYVEVLKSFRHSTQFLVITHNPVTIEAAPIWFGVTMPEPGCTSIIPCQLPMSRDQLVESVVPAQLMN